MPYEDIPLKTLCFHKERLHLSNWREKFPLIWTGLPMQPQGGLSPTDISLPQKKLISFHHVMSICLIVKSLQSTTRGKSIDADHRSTGTNIEQVLVKSAPSATGASSDVNQIISILVESSDINHATSAHIESPILTAAPHLQL